LLAHISANPTEAKAVAVVDLFNEAYYQLLQKLAYKPNTCNGPEGGEACFNEKLVHPFLRSLYSAGKEVAPRFLYTVSATSDLFSEPSPIALYSDVADVYDVHLYSGSPWDAFTASYLSRGKSLGKPWFVGEAGCATSPGTGCSYDGGSDPCVEPEACSLSVDSWWLAHLQSYGAFAVMVQNASTAYSVALEPSLVGKRIAQTNQCAVICNSPSRL